MTASVSRSFRAERTSPFCATRLAHDYTTNTCQQLLRTPLPTTTTYGKF